jgi:hypothetical protein
MTNSQQQRGLLEHADIERCADYDRSVGRCQLRNGHAGSHAISIDAAFITWHNGSVSQWMKAKAPRWLLNLDWTPGYRPTQLISSEASARSGETRD